MISKIKLGSTSLSVSRVGLGTVKFGRNQQVKYPADFVLPTDQALQELLSLAKDLGINLLDTAPAYGLSEERLGKLLTGQRQDWIICSKAGEDFSENQSHYNFTPSHIKKSVERSLQRFKN